MHKVKINSLFVYVFVCIVVLATSCTSTKKTIYFNDLPDSGMLKGTETSKFTEPLIQVDDILSIPVLTTDPSVTATLNINGATSPGSNSSSGAPTATPAKDIGYLVNKNGDVIIPIIGTVHVAGLTTFQASEVIQAKAETFFKLPSVEVRYLNYKINLLGEVNKPGAYILPNEKITILDALSLAGDLTIYGRRDNVLIIRNVGTRKEYGRVDLGSTDLFKSPYYYLKQNDVVYIEPNKAKISTADDAPALRYGTIAVSILTLISIFVLHFTH
jgi:polysaccharide export outer membrane protein